MINFKMIKIKYLILALGLMSATFFTYFDVIKSFFQQDEWLGFARLITLQNDNQWEIIKFAFLPYSLHYTPLSLLSMSLFFSVFHLNFQAYAVTSILLHFISSILIFYLVKILFKNYIYGLLAAFLFITMAAGFQATAWPVADLSIHGATIFGLLSLIFSFKYMKKRKIIYLGLAIISLIISLLYKEITIALTLLIPLAFCFFSEKKLIKNLKVILIFIFLGFIYVFTRVLVLLTSQNNSSVPIMGLVQPLFVTAYNLITFPAKALSQTIFPQGLLLKMSNYIAFHLPDLLTGEKFTYTYNLFVEKKVFEGLSLIIFLVFGGVILYFWKSYSRKKFGKILGFGLIFVLFNSLIFAFSPERSGIVNIIDSRNLYFLSIGVVILILALLDKICKGSTNKVILLVLLIFMINLYWLNYEITGLTDKGIIRKSILKIIKNSYPVLPQNVVFYTESDTPYYGLPVEDKTLPFQSGFGQTLLVWYYPTEKFPKDFYQNKFLWEIKDQGYKEVNGRGFGYFRDLKLLKYNLKKYNISPSSVIAFSWYDRSHSFIDITEKIQKELEDNLQ